MKNQYIIIGSLCILFILTVGYGINYIYGYKIPTDTLFDVRVNIDDNVAYISAETASSGLAFAGYDAELDGDVLLIIPRYSLVSSFNKIGKLEIEYDIEGVSLDKIFIAGDGNDKKQIWPSI